MNLGSIMCNITLIGTIHQELGNCNSDELYKIIESISPDVIFDELSSSSFDMYYSDSFDIYYANSILLNRHPPEVPLEVKCIKKYRQNYNIKIFPVDIDVRQKLSKYQDEIFFMVRTFLKYEDYRKLENEKESLIAKEDFHCLNSDNFLDFLEKKEVIEKKIMESEIQKNRLLDIYKLFHAEQNDNRENAMLQNIYNYSKRNQYNQAVFLIGAEHRKSIIQKIREYGKLSEIKLNWTMYGNK
jgi:hypothetical protein